MRKTNIMHQDRHHFPYMLDTVWSLATVQCSILGSRSFIGNLDMRRYSLLWNLEEIWNVYAVFMPLCSRTQRAGERGQWSFMWVRENNAEGRNGQAIWERRQNQPQRRAVKGKGWKVEKGENGEENNVKETIFFENIYLELELEAHRSRGDFSQPWTRLQNNRWWPWSRRRVHVEHTKPVVLSDN